MTSRTHQVWVPSDQGIRNAFGWCRRYRTPMELIEFMATIGPVVGDPFIVRLIATSVSQIGGMKPPERKIKHLDDLMSQVNFPPEVVRAIEDVVDRVSVPRDFFKLADRMVTPVNDITRAIQEALFVEPPESARQVRNSPIYRKCHEELMTSLIAIRDNLVRSISHNLVTYSLAPETTQQEMIESALKLYPEHSALLDMSARACGMILHHPDTWPQDEPTRMQLMALLNGAKAREAIVQEALDSDQFVSNARKLAAFLDDLIIEYCERTIAAGADDLTTLPFWTRVNQNTPVFEE